MYIMLITLDFRFNNEMNEEINATMHITGKNPATPYTQNTISTIIRKYNEYARKSQKKNKRYEYTKDMHTDVELHDAVFGDITLNQIIKLLYEIDTPRKLYYGV